MEYAILPLAFIALLVFLYLTIRKQDRIVKGEKAQVVEAEYVYSWRDFSEWDQMFKGLFFELYEEGKIHAANMFDLVNYGYDMQKAETDREYRILLDIHNNAGCIRSNAHYDPTSRTIWCDQIHDPKTRPKRLKKLKKAELKESKHGITGATYEGLTISGEGITTKYLHTGNEGVMRRSIGSVNYPVLPSFNAYANRIESGYNYLTDNLPNENRFLIGLRTKELLKDYENSGFSQAEITEMKNDYRRNR